MKKIRPILRFTVHVALAALVLITVPWLAGAALAATGDVVVPPPTPDAIAAYFQSYGWIVGALTVAYIVVGALLKRYATSAWLAQGKRLAYATAILGVAGTALQSFVSGTPVSGVIATAVLGLLHIADAQVTPAPKQTQGGFTTRQMMLVLAAVGVALCAAVGCAGSTTASRQSTLNAMTAVANTGLKSLETYDQTAGAAIVTGATDKAKATTDLQALRGKVAAVRKLIEGVIDAIATGNALNSDSSLTGVQQALDQAMAAVAALTGGK